MIKYSEMSAIIDELENKRDRLIKELEAIDSEIEDIQSIIDNYGLEDDNFEDLLNDNEDLFKAKDEAEYQLEAIVEAITALLQVW